MFIYLSKKIAIPNGVRLQSLSWNPEHGWIAAGGEDGLLKVLKLDSPPVAAGGENSRQAAAASNLSMNQTLDGHHGAVMCVTWNANYRKLTTSDQDGAALGLIIVWMLHKGQWYEEMINNRNKSVVRDMKWTADGGKICIVYEDGAVIVGSVDGNRLWGKELPTGLHLVEWSPDANYILFATSDHELHMYDLMGTLVKSLPLYANNAIGDPAPSASTKKLLRGSVAGIVAIDWYDGVEGHADALAPTLAVAFDTGKVQLTRGTDDTNPVILDTGLSTLRQCKWNTRGTVVAIAGSSEASTGREVSQVIFYSAWGVKMRTLKVPGGGISALSWEGGGLRIALAVDAYIYFANIRPDYRWGFFGTSTLVLAYSPQERSGTSVIFWDVETGARVKTRAAGLRQLRAAGDHCAIISAEKNPRTLGDVYNISLRNAIGAPVEVRTSPVEPVTAAMTSHFVAVADDRYVYVWQYAKLAARGARSAAANKTAAAGTTAAQRASNSKAAEELISLRQSSGRERVLDVQTGATSMLETFKFPQGPNQNKGDPAEDPIVTICCSERLLLVARKSGDLLEYALPHVTYERRYRVHASPKHHAHPPRLVAYNCDATRLAVVDTNGALALVEFPFRLAPQKNSALDDDGEQIGAPVVATIMAASKRSASKKNKQKEKKGARRDYKFGSDDESSEEDDDDDDDERKRASRRRGEEDDEADGETAVTLPFERKDVWDVMWSEDDPTLVAAMEKTKLCVHCTEDLEAPEAPEVCNGYLARFRDLRVTAVVLDGLVANPDKCARSDVVVDVETRRLKEVREAMASQGPAEGYMLVEQQEKPPHPSLWRYLAEASLESLDLGLADRAFVRCHDYQGIQFVKRLRGLSDRMKQRAEVAAYFGRFDEAEQVYRDIDRKDLAVALRERLGDWARVAQLLATSGGGDDAQLQRAYLHLGDDHAARADWAGARTFYDKAADVEKMAEAYYRLDDFGALERLLKHLPNGNARLLLDLARKFESVGLHVPATDAYLRANEPKMAMDCCVLLQQWGRAVELAEEFSFQQMEGLLAKNASRYLQRGDQLLAVELYRKANKPTEAAILLAKIAEDTGVRAANPLRAKKLHVLAALEVERHRKKTLDATLTRTGGTATTADHIAQTTAATLDTLMTQDRESGAAGTKVLDSAWRGAAAYHYFLLAHRQLYAAEMDAAMKTAIRLAEYEDVLARRDIYALIALAAYHNHDFNVCSRAFIKLETLLEEGGRAGAGAGGAAAAAADIQKLALTIFTKHEPSDHHDLPSCYVACLETGTPYQACTVTGRAVLDQRTILCATCRHHALELELRGGTNNCPLCHSPYPAQYRLA